MEEEQLKVSKYSSGVNILLRIDELWKQSHRYRILSQYKKWNVILDSIWTELARDLDEKEYEDKKKIFDMFDRDLIEYGSIIDDLENELGFKPITKDILEKRNKQYEKLMEKQLFLTRLENKLGKGTTWKDSDEDDWEG